MKTIMIGLACLVVAVGFAVQAPNSEAKDPASTESVLIGKWKFKIGNFEGRVIFKESGVAIFDSQSKVTGVWKKETNCILIQWDEVDEKTGCKTWEALTLPLKKEGTLGGNWRDAKVFATKIE